MKKPTLLKKLLVKFLLLSVTGFLVLLFVGRFQFKNIYLEEKTGHLRSMALVLSDSVLDLLKDKNYSKIRELVRKYSIESKQRITVVLSSGEVIADSKKSPSELVNHRDRPEIAEALDGQMSHSIRYSNSLKEESIYVAVPLILEGQVLGVLRHSYITHDLKPVLWDYTWNFFWGTLIIGVLFILLLVLTTRDIGASLNRIHEKARSFAMGDFGDPIPSLPNEPYEISSLVKSLNEMASKLGHLFSKIHRQRNEREAIFTGMSEGVLSIYMDDNIFHWNKSVCQFFGVPYSKDYKGLPYKSVFNNDQISKLVDEIKDCKSFIEEEIVLSNGKVLQMHGSILKQEDGADLGVLMVFNDITRLRELENHRKDFVANVSHELRTQLTSIQGYIETLIEGDVEDKELRTKFLKTIQRNAERLHQITEDLLALSELDKEKSDDRLLLEVSHISGILNSAVHSCEGRAQQKGTRIELDINEDVFMPVNSRLLEQAVVNLIENAIKYGDSGSHVKVGMTKIGDAQDLISIHVSDSGPGIPSEHLDRLFERFYSVDKARSRELGGSGLGLSIVKNIAHAHGGNVSVESQVGVGSTFSIQLPLQ